jgi:hypothetical protein
MKFDRRIRLSSFLLFISIVALALCVLAEKRRQAELQRAIQPFRSARAEAVWEALQRPLAAGAPDGSPLEDALKDIKRASTGLPKLPTGIPIYVDPIGLQETEQTMTSLVGHVAEPQTLTLRERLAQMLEPLGLAGSPKDGWLMITSKAAVELPDEDPYLGYRDVLP